MLKTPETYARMVLDCFFGDVARAQAELFNQARLEPAVPTTFWRDAYNFLPRLALQHYGITEEGGEHA